MRKKPNKAVLLLILILYLTVYVLAIWILSWTLYSDAKIALIILFTIAFIFSIFLAAILLTDWRPNFSIFKRREESVFDFEQNALDAITVLEQIRVNKLECYNCKDVFTEVKETCNKCGTPRPNCIICGLTLSPETDLEERIVITPCCSIYVHLDHMLEWLEVREECPNCKLEIIREDFFKGYNF
ncbi:MAG: hypothetical protein ACW96U_06540 [Candidatus Heimdallarchaeaceae archaeon]|jgi:hypothetical protein